MRVSKKTQKEIMEFAYNEAISAYAKAKRMRNKDWLYHMRLHMYEEQIIGLQFIINNVLKFDFKFTDFK